MLAVFEMALRTNAEVKTRSDYCCPDISRDPSWVQLVQNGPFSEMASHFKQGPHSMSDNQIVRMALDSFQSSSSLVSLVIYPDNRNLQL